VRAPFEALVAEWSAHWVAKGRLSLSDWALAAGARDAGWRAYDGGLAVNCPGRAATRLLSLALDARIDHAELNGRDRRLTDGLADRMMQDLVRRTLTVLGTSVAPASGPRDRDIVATISDGADTLMSLAIPLRSVLPICRRTLPRPAQPTTALQHRLTALGPITLKLDAMLGSAQVTLAEAQALSIGDILVLDRRLNDAADLSLANPATLVARGVLTEADGQVALILQSTS
jgi:flagellar motor switch/type III secretory pathway protein FliN